MDSINIVSIRKNIELKVIFLILKIHHNEEIKNKVFLFFLKFNLQNNFLKYFFMLTFIILLW